MADLRDGFGAEAEGDFRRVKQSGDAGQAHRRHINDAAAGKEAVQEGEQNQGDGQRVEQHQHRNGEFDDGT